MAIAAVFEFPSEPVEKYHKVFDAGPAIVNQPDRIYHVCYRTETGFTVIDIWTNEQSFVAFGKILVLVARRHRFLNPRFCAASHLSASMNAGSPSGLMTEILPAGGAVPLIFAPGPAVGSNPCF